MTEKQNGTGGFQNRLIKKEWDKLNILSRPCTTMRNRDINLKIFTL